MKKEGQDNIVLFPNVERRLAEKGIEALQLKKFGEAIRLLEQGIQLDPDNGDLMAALVLAYFESGSLKKAKEMCKSMLLSGTGDYFQMVEMYITILIQLHEYKEITEVLNALLEEKEIPKEKKEHFLTILQFSERLADNEPDFLIGDETVDEELGLGGSEEILPGDVDFFELKDPKEQVMVAGKLASQDISPFLPEISRFLESPDGQPFFKTVLLNVLREQQVHQETTIEKFGMVMKALPDMLPALHSLQAEREIGELLAGELEQSDPVLLDSALSLVGRHSFALYPFEVAPDSASAWAAAFHYTAMVYLGSSPDEFEIGEKYKADAKDVQMAAAWIRKVEEISYPIN